MDSILIHLLRDGQPDHVITIRPRRTRDSFLVVQKEGAHDRWNHIYDSGEVINFLSGLLYLLGVDEDPYSHVQITFPGVPAVMIPIRGLTNDRILDHVQSILQQILDHYPAHWVA